MSNASILGLRLPSDPRWVDLASLSLQEILWDHAFCEQKAASSCMSLIQGYPSLEQLVADLAPVVTEEWGHFRQVLAELHKRGWGLGPQRKDPYVNALMSCQIKGGSSEARLLDKLLMAALIEARSCERFRLLNEGLQDAYFREFYRRFMESEAGHYRLFVDLAKTYLPEDQVRQRWTYWLNEETRIVTSLPVRGDRMH